MHRKWAGLAVIGGTVTAVSGYTLFIDLQGVMGWLELNHSRRCHVPFTATAFGKGSTALLSSAAEWGTAAPEPSQGT